MSFLSFLRNAFLRRKPRRPAHSRRASTPPLLTRKPIVEFLEDRTCPSGTVLNLDNSGFGSLRQAILDAAPGDTIVFQQGVTGTISLSSTLAITKDVTIDGPSSSLLSISGNNTIEDFSIS